MSLTSQSNTPTVYPVVNKMKVKQLTNYTESSHFSQSKSLHRLHTFGEW